MNTTTKTASSIYFTASLAAEDALPPESLALIKRRDELGRLWAAKNWTAPVPPELDAANKAVDADPLASAAMHIRRLGNEAMAAEHSTKRAA